VRKLAKKKAVSSFMVVLMIIFALAINGCADSDDSDENSLIPQEAPSEMTGKWEMRYTYGSIDTVATLTLNDDGSFDYSDSAVTTYGSWGMEGDDFTMQFYLATGNGSVFSGTVNAERSSIDGSYRYFDGTTGSWSAEK